MGKLSKYIEGLHKVLKGEWTYRNVEEYETEYNKTLKKVREEDWSDVQELLLACIASVDKNIMHYYAKPMMERTIGVILWKDHPEVITSILQQLYEHGQVSAKTEYTSRDRSSYRAHMQRKEETTDIYSDFMEHMVTMLNTYQMLPKYTDILFDLLFAALTVNKSRLHTAVTEFTKELPWNKNTRLSIKFIKKIHGIIENNIRLAQEDSRVVECIETSLNNLYHDCRGNDKQAVKYAPHVAALFNLCFDQELNKKEFKRRTLSHIILKDTIYYFLREHCSKKEVIHPMFQACKQLAKGNNPRIRENVQLLVNNMPGNILVETDEDTARELIEKFFNGQDYEIIAKFESMYKACPDLFNGQLDAIAITMDDVGTNNIASGISFFHEVMKQRPQSITDTCMQCLMSQIEAEYCPGLVLIYSLPLAEKRPKMFWKYEDAIMDSMRNSKNTVYHGANILVHMGRNSEKRTAKYLEFLHELAPNCESIYVGSLFYNMKQLGQEYPKLLAKYEQFFIGYLDNPVVSQHAETVLNDIHGRSLAAISQDMEHTQKGMEQIEERVKTTEENVENISREANQDKTMGAVPKLQERSKSIPKWASKISKLLNEEHSQDWRSLAKRLGYNISDIKKFAKHENPCLVMLEQWLNSIDVVDPSLIVLQKLAEMERMDVKTVAMKCIAKEKRRDSRAQSLMEKVNSRMTNDTEEMMDIKLQTMRNQIVEDLGAMIESKISEACNQMIEVHQKTAKRVGVLENKIVSVERKLDSILQKGSSNSNDMTVTI